MSINPRSSRAFSLVEVTIALAVLALIMGSIYAVLRGTLQTAGALREAQIRQQQIDGLMDLCRHTFRMLPANATLEGRVREQEGQNLSEVIFRNAPELLAWSPPDDFNAISVLGLRPQIGGNFFLGLLRVSPIKDSLADPIATARPDQWLTLVPDVAKADWRFFDPRSGQWLDVLPAGMVRPTAVELTLLLAGDKTPLQTVFWIVPIVPQMLVNTAGLTTPQPAGSP